MAESRTGTAIARDTSDVVLLDLRRRWPRFLAFVISVAVVGTVLLSHHEFVARLQKGDGGLLGLSIPYLGLIVLIPCVQSVLGEGAGEPLTGREARLEVARTGVPIVLLGSSAWFALVIGEWVVLFWVAIWPIDAVLARFDRRAV